MITVNQLAAALYGIWLVLKLDPRGFAYFEKTPGGFGRSFLAAAVIAPMQLAHMLLIYGQSRPKLAFVPFMVVQILAFVLSWVSYPFVMLYVTALLNRQGRYFWQMVPYNWLQLAIDIPLVTLALLADVHVIPARAFLVVTWFTLVLSFSMFIFLARRRPFRWGLERRSAS